MHLHLIYALERGFSVGIMQLECRIVGLRLQALVNHAHKGGGQVIK